MAECGQCGGAGCSAVGLASDCCVTEIVEEGKPCSETNEAPCYIGKSGSTFFWKDHAAPSARVWRCRSLINRCWLRLEFPFASFGLSWRM